MSGENTDKAEFLDELFPSAAFPTTALPDDILLPKISQQNKYAKKLTTYIETYNLPQCGK